MVYRTRHVVEVPYSDPVTVETYSEAEKQARFAAKNRNAVVTITTTIEVVDE